LAELRELVYWKDIESSQGRLDACHPHMMLFTPYHRTRWVGGNPFGSAQVTDDHGMLSA
jgi:hypothetical protein